MNHSLVAFALQEPASDSSMWIIIIAVVVILFFIVVIIVVGLIIFFVMRKRSKAKSAAASAPYLSSGTSPGPVAPYSEVPASAASEVAALDTPAQVFEPIEEMRADVYEATPPSMPVAADDSGALDFDPSRTVAITRENTVAISYGTIKFVSGVLSGEEFEVNPEGSYIGRESSLSQIVVSDPRISKRHLWVGVRDGLVTVVDQDSRNGTFVNDPKSERITEATLQSGDTVILGESDVARFEYHA